MMAFGRKDYAVRSAEDGWVVIRGGDRRPTARVATRKSAVAKATQLSRKAGGEVRVLGSNGKIVRSNRGGGSVK